MFLKKSLRQMLNLQQTKIECTKFEKNNQPTCLHLFHLIAGKTQNNDCMPINLMHVFCTDLCKYDPLPFVVRTQCVIISIWWLNMKYQCVIFTSIGKISLECQVIIGKNFMLFNIINENLVILKIVYYLWWSTMRSIFASLNIDCRQSIGTHCRILFVSRKYLNINMYRSCIS
jgi:hypothetical protein